MFKIKKDKGLAPVFVVTILMLCAVVVSKITYDVSLNVSGYSVQGTYDAYETLTGYKISQNKPEDIAGGIGNISIESDNNSMEEFIPASGFYVVSIEFYDPQLGWSYEFDNRLIFLVCEYNENCSDMTYRDFLKDDKKHPEFDCAEGTLNSKGTIYIEDRGPSDIQYIGASNSHNGWNDNIKMSDMIEWTYDSEYDFYWADICIETSFNLKEGERIHSFEFEAYNIETETYFDYMSCSFFATKEIGIEDVKETAKINISEDFSVYTSAKGNKYTIEEIVFFTEEDGWQGASPSTMIDKTFTWEDWGNGVVGNGIYISVRPYVEPEYIPAGGEYIKFTGEVLREGDIFPKPEMGDIYTYNDYEYRYNARRLFYNNPYWITSDNINGWGVAAIDTSKQYYSEILKEIAGCPIVDINLTFYKCSNMLESPEIPETVNSMMYAFYGCSSLRSAPKLPEGIPDLLYTFCDCKTLTKAPLVPMSVTNMNFAYQGCSSLVDVPEFPDGIQLESISNIFSGCSSLTKIPKIPETVVYLDGAFQGCTSLVNAPIIPQNVKSLNRTFYECTSLAGNVEINSNVSYYRNCFLGTEKPIIITGISSERTKQLLAATATNGNVTY